MCLIETHRRWINTVADNIARQFHVPRSHPTADDLRSEAMLAVCKIVNDFDPGVGDFKNFIYWPIVSACRRFITKDIRAMKMLRSEVPDIREATTADHTDFEDLIETLPDERTRRMLRLRFVHDMTQAEIAAEEGVSQQWVSEIINKALQDLRPCLE